jgi:hypothetical protein
MGISRRHTPVTDAITVHVSSRTLVTLGVILVGGSFLGPGFPLLVAGVVLMTIGGVLASSGR